LSKYVFLSGLILNFVLLGFAKEEDLLKIDTSLIPDNLPRGKEGKIVLKLDLKKGITISPQPFFVIEFNPCEELVFSKNSFSESDLKIETIKENGEEYLNLKRPVEIPFTVRLKAKRGNHRLEGRIKYFACSKEEGWCLKSSAEFSASFIIKK